MKGKFTAALACLLAATAVAQVRAPRQTEIKEWQFSKDQSAWETVSVPHSCNAADGRSPKYYRGKAYYRKSLNLSKDDAKRPLFLLFEGAAQAATVSVNGKTAKQHKGGYTPFVVNLGGLVREGENQIEVCTDNTEDVQLIPVSSDFNKNNGLHNPVYLLSMNEQYLCPAAFGMYRLHVSTPYVSDSEAVAVVETRVVNKGRKAMPLRVAVTLSDASGKAVAESSEVVNVDAGTGKYYTSRLTVSHPHLWNGLADPYRYSAKVVVSDKRGREIDHAETRMGFRYFQLSQSHGFMLNGKPYPLRGISEHQDCEGMASAVTHEQTRQDYEIIHELGANVIRMAHYPHNDYEVALCDSLGIIVQTEIPWVNVCGVNAKPEYFSNIHQQMKEMIGNLYNHPSIVFWGMWNEVDSWGNTSKLQGKFDAARLVAESNRLYDYAKSLDPYRAVGLTDCSVFARPGYEMLKGDFFSENRYNGWYYRWKGGINDALEREMNHIRQTMGPASLSEYGAGANPFCHTQDSATLATCRNDDSRHYEEYQNYVHESSLRMITRMSYLTFTTLWIMFDFPVASRREGYYDSDDGLHFTENEARKYTNDKGLVTRDRKVKKDAFYLYKAAWNKSEPTVYITSRRMRALPEGQPARIHVYSNARSLSLYRDDQLLERLDSCRDATGVVWDFKPVKMNDGENTFRVVADDGTSDSVTWSVARK